MCVPLSLRICASICVASCCLSSLNAMSQLFPLYFASFASSHHFKVHTRLSQNVNFVPCLSGAMTQPFVANASAVLCYPAYPTSNSSGNNVAAHITNTLESTEAPVLKFNQVVKTQDHAMSELSKQSSDALEMFSQVSHEPCSFQYTPGYSSVQNSNKCLGDVPRCWRAQFLAWP